MTHHYKKMVDINNDLEASRCQIKIPVIQVSLLNKVIQSAKREQNFGVNCKQGKAAC